MAMAAIENRERIPGGTATIGRRLTRRSGEVTVSGMAATATPATASTPR